MEHALTMWNDIVPVLEKSEPEGIDIGCLVERDGKQKWELCRQDMIFPSEREAKKYIFLKRLKGK